MQQRIINILNQIAGRWKALGRPKQIRFVVAASVLALALAATAYFITRPEMMVIETDMDMQELAEAVSTLEGSGIKTQVANNTTALSVPRESVNDARLLLATSGIQTSEITYSDALNVSIGTPESARNQINILAKQTEIENSIKMLNNVRGASVMLSIPDASPFILRDQDMPTAAVVLDASGELSGSQVEAIAYHVSRSVQNLKLENVSIMDTNNRSLFQTGANGIAGGLSLRQEAETARKQEVENQVKMLLNPQFDMVDAMATLEWDWTGSSTSRITHTPYGDTTTGIPARQTLSESTVENTEPGNEPGMQTNDGQMPEYPTGTGVNSNASQMSSDTDYYVDTETTVTENPGLGRLLRDDSSLAVVGYVNRIYKQDDLIASGQLDDMSWEDFKTNVMISPVPIDLTNTDFFERIINATGIDNVIINAYERPIFEDSVRVVRPINQLLMAGLLLLLIGLLALGLIRRTQPEITQDEPELSIEGLLASNAAQDPVVEEPVAEIDYFAESELKKQIDKFIDEKPESAAQLLRNWLSEEWE